MRCVGVLPAQTVQCVVEGEARELGEVDADAGGGLISVNEVTVLVWCLHSHSALIRDLATPHLSL